MRNTILQIMIFLFCLPTGCHQQATTRPSPQHASKVLPSEPLSEESVGLPEEPLTELSPEYDCSNDIRITEIMYDPTGTLDSLGEYVEFFNPSNQIVRLKNWKLSNGRREHVLMEEEFNLPPGGVVVLAASLDPDENGDIPADLLLDGLSLANSGSLLHLQNPCGETSTRFRYSTKPPWPRAKAGVAIELRDPHNAPSNPAHWQHSTSPLPTGDKGTPGFHEEKTQFTEK